MSRLTRSLGAAALAWVLAGTAWAQPHCGDGSCDYPPETPCNCDEDCPNAPPINGADGCCRANTAGVDCSTDADCPCAGDPMVCTSPGMGIFTCSGCGGACGTTYDSCSCPDFGGMGMGCVVALDNGCCDSGEDETMTADCLAECGNLICETGEQPYCPGDCPSVCPNGVCESDETECNCPADCPANVCDGCCGPAETACDCRDDCPNFCCGDMMCDMPRGETPGNCPGDCTCGNGICDPGEDSCTCGPDCPGMPCCGNDICETSPPPGMPTDEDCCSCPADCLPCPGLQVCGPSCTCGICGNGTKDAGENCGTCLVDSPCAAGEVCDPDDFECTRCGNTMCEPPLGETCGTCFECACMGTLVCDGVNCVSCGNGTCEPGLSEDCGTCSADCLCEPGPDVAAEPDMSIDAPIDASDADMGEGEAEAEPEADAGGEGEAEAEAEAEGEGSPEGCSCRVASANGPSALVLLGILGLLLSVGVRSRRR